MVDANFLGAENEQIDKLKEENKLLKENLDIFVNLFIFPSSYRDFFETKFEETEVGFTFYDLVSKYGAEEIINRFREYKTEVDSVTGVSEKINI